VSGAKIASRAATASSTQAICPAAGWPASRPRSAVTRWLTGLTCTNACSHPGMVWGWTNTLLARVSGNSTTVPALITACAVRSSRPTAVQAHDRHSAKARYPFLWLQPAVDPGKDASRHAPVLDRMLDIVRRGQASGDFDDSVPAHWLLSASLALGRATEDEVKAGRMTIEQATQAMHQSVLRLLGAG
jgi:hypothetical protein